MRALAAHEVVRGRFSQQRQVPGLEQPLVSGGAFLFWRSGGLHWQTEQPFPLVTVLRQDATLQYDPGAQERPDVLAGRSETLRRELLLDLFRFDRRRLAANFEQAWQVGEDGSWELLLTPKRGMLRRALTDVRMRGAGLVEYLRINYADGGYLVLTFSDQRVLEEPPAAACGEFQFTEAQCQSRRGAQP